MNKLPPPSFILNIWNVNEVKTVHGSDMDTGFILTIWNVNVLESEIAKLLAEGFILTIWNVNYSPYSSSILS